jgi:hypothetical protein
VPSEGLKAKPQICEQQAGNEQRMNNGKGSTEGSVTQSTIIKNEQNQLKTSVELQKVANIPLQNEYLSSDESQSQQDNGGLATEQLVEEKHQKGTNYNSKKENK